MSPGPSRACQRRPPNGGQRTGWLDRTARRPRRLPRQEGSRPARLRACWSSGTQGPRSWRSGRQRGRRSGGLGPRVGRTGRAQHQIQRERCRGRRGGSNARAPQPLHPEGGGVQRCARRRHGPADDGERAGHSRLQPRLGGPGTAPCGRGTASQGCDDHTRRPERPSPGAR